MLQIVATRCNYCTRCDCISRVQLILKCIFRKVGCIVDYEKLFDKDDDVVSTLGETLNCSRTLVVKNKLNFLKQEWLQDWSAETLRVDTYFVTNKVKLES